MATDFRLTEKHYFIYPPAIYRVNQLRSVHKMSAI